MVSEQQWYTEAAGPDEIVRANDVDTYKTKGIGQLISHSNDGS